MSDQAFKSEDQHRIDTLQEMANTEHQLRMARTQYETAKGELVRAAEALIEWQAQWNSERRAVFACYPDAMPVDSVVEDARATMDRFCAEIEARHAAYGKPAPITNEWHGDYVADRETAREQLEREPEIEPVPSDEQDDASEFISDLTGDPAIEPESGLHEEAVERTATKLFNEHWGRTEESDGSLWPLSRQHPGIQEAWREKARELLAAPTPAVMEMANEIIEEAPALNPHMHDEREQPVQTEQERSYEEDDKQAAFEQGRAAYLRGNVEGKCPYAPREHSLYTPWMNGWIDAHPKPEITDADRAWAMNAAKDIPRAPPRPEPDGYAPVTNPTIDDLIPEAMRQELEAEQRYAQPTNPDADERAKLNDWYDPKAVHERERFNPFAMFRRQTEDV